jgi:branched-chain amino acid transport system ATP-binding protein
MSLLEVRGLEVRYGGIRAVKGIDLAVEEGELVCLIGANGAGKSSTLRAISGLTASPPGAVRYAGRDLAGMRAFERVRAGLVMVPEGRGVFPQLTSRRTSRWAPYARTTAGSRRIGSGCSSSFRGCASAARRPAARSPAASSRCSRSAAR